MFRQTIIIDLGYGLRLGMNFLQDSNDFDFNFRVSTAHLKVDADSRTSV